MPSNLTITENPYYDLSGQTVMQYQVADLAEAIDTARGRMAYLFWSSVIEAWYLYVLVEITPIVDAANVLLVRSELELAAV